MDGFMPVEPLAHQPKKRILCGKCIPESDLILDNHVYCGVHFLIGKG